MSSKCPCIMESCSQPRRFGHLLCEEHLKLAGASAPAPGPVETAKLVETILAEAERIVAGPRRDTYGSPLENHTRTAAMWSAYLGVTITPRQVCELNILQKVSRDAHSPKRDNLVDIAGWARNAELCEPKPGA